MELPRSLAPWSRYLGIFPRETSLAIGPLVQRIALAVGPMKSRSLSGSGDPDGFDDLARRGSYERLLASEWLLADEAPEEFARRAGMGEHVFLRIARREPSGSRVSLALFDAGPNQIGSPRLAHLAALIVLARRAEAAGARFSWGVLQTPEMPIIPDVSESNVLMLMAARNAKEATDEHIHAWKTRVEGWKDLDDLWLIGGARIAALPSGSGLSLLIVRDLIEPEARQVSVMARHVARPARNVVLDLPPDSDCVRLIRDPFAASFARPRAMTGEFAPQSNLIFDANGAKLFARASNGRIISFPIPTSPRAGTGKPRIITATTGHWVEAVGRIGRATALLTRVGEASRVVVVGRGSTHFGPRDYRSVHQTIEYVSSKQRGSELYPILRIPSGQGPPRSQRPVRTSSLWDLAVLDDRRSLFRLGHIEHAESAHPPGDLGMWLVGQNVLAVAATNFGVVFVGQEVPGKQWRIVFLGQQSSSRELPFEAPPSRAFFGYGASFAHRTFGFVAIENSNSHEWLVVTQFNDLNFGVVSGGEVVGAVLDPRHHKPALVSLKDDHRTLALSGPYSTFERLFPEANAEIVDVTVSSALPNIGYSTVEGDVVVYSLARRADLCRFQAAGGQQ